MKKKLYIFIISLLLLFSFFSYKFILNAREKRTWPFNSSIGLYLPQWIKFYAYNFTNPQKKIITTQYYKINIDYYAIPSKKSVGGGGAINLLKKNFFLITLNNGENFLFNISTKKFSKLNFSFKKYSGIRDVNLNVNKKEITILGIKRTQKNCKKIYLDKYSYNILNNIISIKEEFKNIWSSEELCNNPVENNGGGRIVELDNIYYVSTGFFAQNKNSGIYKFSQDLKSSFGKIIKIEKKKGEYNYKILSIGHRNPQGLFFSKKHNLIIETEHGPQGGDEINIIQENGNYGWPCTTWGARYDYNFKKESIIWPKDLTEYGCEKNKINNYYKEPLFSWSPSVAVSQGLEYQGDEFKKFNNSFLIGSLKATSIFRLYMSGDKKIINYEKIFINERIRDIDQTKSGIIVLLTDGGNLLLLTRKI